MRMEGVLPIWKPAGWTSHDVVAKVRRIIGIKRIGHTGTLDPAVTGVLLLCLGRATRLVEYIQELPKVYEAKLKLGIATDTEDMTGAVLERRERVEVSLARVEQALNSFVGEIEQVPPMFSAVRVNGKRLYELAREGRVVERKPRVVTVHRIDLLDAVLDKPYPEIQFRVTCSKGTYIRTLCVDIGRTLQQPAAMSELIRTSTGSISRDQCVTLEQAEELHRMNQLHQRIIPADRILSDIPAAQAAEDAVEPLLQGQRRPSASVTPLPDQNGLIRLYDSTGRFLGLYSLEQDREWIRPIKVFL